MKEEWKDIKEYEGLYQISNMGRVKSIHYHRSRLAVDKCLVPRIPPDRYPYVGLFKNGKLKHVYLHRLVAEYFIPNPDNKPYVNHKDGDKTNNRVDNLEWVTAKENTLHQYRVLHKVPIRRFKYNYNKNSKPVSQFLIDENGFEYKLATYANAYAAALVNNISASSINSCCRGDKNYSHVGGFIWRYEKKL